MSVVYVETSALLTWMLGQPGGETVRKVIDESETAVTSTLTSIEAMRAIARAEEDSVVSAKDAQALRGQLHRVLTEWIQMEITGTVGDRASRAFPSEPVRTLDAIHLATALEFAMAFPDIEMLSSDDRVRDNAAALGLRLSS